jgi:hypothetical protein
MRANSLVRGSGIFRELRRLCRVNLFQLDRVLGFSVGCTITSVPIPKFASF